MLTSELHDLLSQWKILSSPFALASSSSGSMIFFFISADPYIKKILSIKPEITAIDGLAIRVKIE